MQMAAYTSIEEELDIGLSDNAHKMKVILSHLPSFYRMAFRHLGARGRAMV
jgi:hypothetical protein